jgi:hypothetical protein
MITTIAIIATIIVDAPLSSDIKRVGKELHQKTGTKGVYDRHMLDIRPHSIESAGVLPAFCYNPVIPLYSMTALFIILVVLSVIANMAIGSVWYMPKIFGAMWQKDVKLDSSKIKKDTMVKAMGTSAVTYAVTAAILGYIRQIAFMGTMQQWLVALFILWIVFVLCVRISHALFEQRSLRYIAITSGHDLVNILATGAIMFYA